MVHFVAQSVVYANRTWLHSRYSFTLEESVILALVCQQMQIAENQSHAG